MFRLGNVDGRAALACEGSWYDIATLTGDERFADPLHALERHAEQARFAAAHDAA